MADYIWIDLHFCRSARFHRILSTYINYGVFCLSFINLFINQLKIRLVHSLGYKALSYQFEVTVSIPVDQENNQDILEPESSEGWSSTIDPNVASTNGSTSFAKQTIRPDFVTIVFTRI